MKRRQPWEIRYWENERDHGRIRMFLSAGKRRMHRIERHEGRREVDRQLNENKAGSDD